MASMAGMWRFPYYATHRPYHQLIEYAGWLRRLALKRQAERRAAEAIEGLPDGPDPLFLFPLQLDCDYQVRVHSPFRAMHLAIEHVLSSFAAHAPGAARLIVKLHPLDSGLVDEDQEPPDELNYLTEDDLPSEIPSSDVVLRELEAFLRQHQQDPGPNSGSDDPSDSA